MIVANFDFIFTMYIGMMRGAGANVRVCEIETPCSNPVEVALADLFHFEA